MFSGRVYNLVKVKQGQKVFLMLYKMSTNQCCQTSGNKRTTNLSVLCLLEVMKGS